MLVCIWQRRQKQRGLCRLKVPISLSSCIKRKTLEKKKSVCDIKFVSCGEGANTSNPSSGQHKVVIVPLCITWLIQLGSTETQRVKLLKSTKWQALLFLWEIFPYSPGYNPLDNNLELNVITAEISHRSNIQDTFLVYYPLWKKKRHTAK